MAELKKQMKEKAKDLKEKAKDLKKHLINHGRKAVGACKKGWDKLRKKINV